MALVIKSWYAERTPNEKGDYVHLVARKAGLVAFLLAVLEIDSTAELRVKDSLIVHSVGSLAGRSVRVIPLKSLTSAYYGYVKEWKVPVLVTVILVSAGLASLVSLDGGILRVASSVAIILLGLGLGPMIYLLKKTLVIEVTESSGLVSSFAFRRSVIEGQRISEREAFKVVDIVRALIEKDSA